MSRALRRLLLHGAALAVARQRVGDHVSGEYAALCSECHVFGHHAHKLVREAVARGAAPSRRDWARTLDDHCANRRLATHAEDASQAMLCESVLAGRNGALLADALWDLVDGADGDGDDSTIASAAAVADALCAFDSVTEACPRNFRVHHAPTDTYEAAAVQHAFRNGARGAVEILVIDGAVGRACAPEEEDAAFDGADSLERKFLAPGGAGKGCAIPDFKGSELGRFPLVSADFWTSDHPLERSRSVDALFLNARARKARVEATSNPAQAPGEEKVFALARPAPRRGDAPDLEETTYRVKPRRGDCADGFDLYVDFTARFLQYAVEDRAAFDPAKPRSNANCPLNVTLAPDLMPYGTDVQPDDRPPHMRHSAIPKKHRRRKRREL